MRRRASVCPAPVLDAMVVEALEGSPRPLSAYHIADRLQGRRGAAQVASVYRSIERLTEAGRVERVETLSAYRLSERRTGILLVCGRCGMTRTLAMPAMRMDIAVEVLASGFRLGRLVIEAVGRCTQCPDGTPLP